MNTVDALLELGKALCGNDFELAPNMTDAEAIREIARNYQPPEGGGSVDLIFPVEVEADQSAGTMTCATNFDDILEAVNAGKTLEIIITAGGQEYMRGVANGSCITPANDQGTAISLTVTSIAANDNQLYVFYYIIERNGAVSMSNFVITADQ